LHYAIFKKISNYTSRKFFLCEKMTYRLCNLKTIHARVTFRFRNPEVKKNFEIIQSKKVKNDF